MHLARVRPRAEVVRVAEHRPGGGAASPRSPALILTFSLKRVAAGRQPIYRRSAMRPTGYFKNAAWRA